MQNKNRIQYKCVALPSFGEKQFWVKCWNKVDLLEQSSQSLLQEVLQICSLVYFFTLEVEGAFLSHLD